MLMRCTTFAWRTAFQGVSERGNQSFGIPLQTELYLVIFPFVTLSQGFLDCRSVPPLW